MLYRHSDTIVSSPVQVHNVLVRRYGVQYNLTTTKQTERKYGKERVLPLRVWRCARITIFDARLTNSQA
jgi:hypothetical protein